MKRRRFLQLAASLSASLAAGAVVPRSYALSPLLLCLAKVSLAPGVGLTGTLITLGEDPVPTRSALAALSSAEVSFKASTKKNASELSPDALIEMLWERSSSAPDEQPQWIMNGRPYKESGPLLLFPGQHYRLRMMNATGQEHPVHLPQHGFQVTRIRQTAVSGTYQNAIRLERYSALDADLIVRHPLRPVLSFEVEPDDLQKVRRTALTFK